MEALEVARKVVEVAGEKLAVDMLILDIRSSCSFADFFVIVNGESERQIKAIYEEVRHSLKEAGVYPHHYEGTPGSGWVLIDFGDVIVHIFSPEERENYQLDKLWNEATTVLRIQ